MKPPKTRTDGHSLGWFAVYVQSLVAQMAFAVELAGLLFGDLSGLANDLLDAIGSALHCLCMERLEVQA